MCAPHTAPTAAPQESGAFVYLPELLRKVLPFAQAALEFDKAHGTVASGLALRDATIMLLSANDAIPNQRPNEWRCAHDGGDPGDPAPPSCLDPTVRASQARLRSFAASHAPRATGEVERRIAFYSVPLLF